MRHVGNRFVLICFHFAEIGNLNIPSTATRMCRRRFRSSCGSRRCPTRCVLRVWANGRCFPRRFCTRSSSPTFCRFCLELGSGKNRPQAEREQQIFISFCFLFLASGWRSAASFLLACQLSKEPTPAIGMKSVNLIHLNSHFSLFFFSVDNRNGGMRVELRSMDKCDE